MYCSFRTDFHTRKFGKIDTLKIVDMVIPNDRDENFILKKLIQTVAKKRSN